MKLAVKQVSFLKRIIIALYGRIIKFDKLAGLSQANEGGELIYLPTKELNKAKQIN